ncbi:hypothetical protein HNO88_002098 [Novosphingobium chloroacetimidivorans]|uniref:Uncharacterized protein n=1 Tax=Novosphingobium chloroacetimidivorans TaxID=1428314 RepID=A0A7W7NX54_9SPHN|nr:hypothetical protein [Novosphingobium chloroacetimidivorans]
MESRLRSLHAAPGGIRWSELLKSLTAANPETPPNSIRGATHQLYMRHSGEL